MAKIHPVSVSEPCSHWGASYEVPCRAVLQNPVATYMWDDLLTGANLVMPKGACRKCCAQLPAGASYVYGLIDGKNDRTQEEDL